MRAVCKAPNTFLAHSKNKCHHHHLLIVITTCLTRRSLACIQIIHSIILHRVSNRAGFLSRDSINFSPRYTKLCWLCTTFGRFEKTVKNHFLCSVIQMRTWVSAKWCTQYWDPCVNMANLSPWNWLPFMKGG